MIDVKTYRVLRITPQVNEPCDSVVYLNADAMPVIDEDHVVAIHYSVITPGTLVFRDDEEPVFTPDVAGRTWSLD